MKFAFLVGGFTGFALVTVAGFTAGRAADLVLRDAALGCLAGALLFRWFWSVVIRAFTEETPQYDKVKWKEVGDDDMERVTHGLILCCELPHAVLCALYQSVWRCIVYWPVCIYVCVVLY